MVYKLIEVVGISEKGFDEAAKDAVEVASKTVHGIIWAEVNSLHMKVHEDNSVEYQARMKIGFEVKPEYKEPGHLHH
ncbi:MAG: dodecin family protein [Thaumarchaeota archaeon]|nr:dodecin family protein [Nitrososphaerota archaeon]MCL5316810.1 dodecin family protein [Nitrososphaerota archaeon]